MKTPFKFLDAYTLEDRDKFFGRDRETEELYEMTFKTSLVMVYGLSGTGKTSLVQCGLAARFDGPDWFPFLVRRQENINESLHSSLAKGLAAFAATPPDNLLSAIRDLYRFSYRPVYLIFDQFEELFILGSQAEQTEFIEGLKELLHSGLPCKVILVLREEYLGYLYPFEKVIPGLFDFRLRVEPMSTKKAKTVAASSFEQFNIALEAPQADNLQLIVDNISAEKSGIHLPFLQVYLDRMYFEKYRQTYGDQPRNGELPPLEFTWQDITRFGEIEVVLKKFLEDRKEDLERQLNARFDTRYTQVAGEVLDAFVTDEGTKRPVFFSWAKGGTEMRVEAGWRKFFPGVSDAYLSACFQFLEQNRILRISEDTVELAHDSLAHLIDEMRTDEQRQRKEIKRRILTNYREFQQTGEYLTGKQLAVYEAFLPELDLNEDVRRFVTASEAEVERKEREKVARQRRKLLRQRIFMVAISLAALLALGLAAYVADQNNKIKLAYAETLKEQGDFKAAADRISEVNTSSWPMFFNGGAREAIATRQARYRLLDSLVGLANTLSKQDSFGNYLSLESLARAQEYYAAAYRADSIGFLKERADNLKKYIEQESDNRIREARDILERLGGPEGSKLAREYLEIAKSLDSGRVVSDPELREMLNRSPS